MEAECTCDVVLETSAGRVTYPAPVACLRLCAALELHSAPATGGSLSESVLARVECRTSVKAELPVGATARTRMTLNAVGRR